MRKEKIKKTIITIIIIIILIAALIITTKKISEIKKEVNKAKELQTGKNLPLGGAKIIININNTNNNNTNDTEKNQTKK